MKNEMLVMIGTLIIYLVMVAGVYLVYADFISSTMEKIRMLRRLRARERQMREEGEIKMQLRQSLLMVVGRPVSPEGFFFIIVIIFLLVFFVGSRSLGLLAASFVSVTAASLPCLLLWIRVNSIRRRGSHEGERLVSEFLREYRISGFNVYETIDKVIQSPSEIKVTRKLMSKLLYSLRSTANPVQIKKATDEFAYGVRTNWSLMLAHDIYLAAERGSNVSLAVEDILIQLREARTIAEERKRLNSEAIRMTFYLVPLIYGATVFMSVKYLDVPIGKFIKNQFATTEGMILFLFMLFMFVGNVALLQLVTNQRFDY